MPADRYYLHDPLLHDSLVIFTGKEHQHLAKVMRVKEGEEIEIVNGRGIIAIGKVKEIKRHETFVYIRQAISHSPPDYRIILVQAMPKLNRLEWILEKGCELGVAEFWTFPTKLSEKKPLTPNQNQRLDQILISAMKQCGIYYLPTLRTFSSMDEIEWVNPAFFGDLDPDAPKLVSCLEKKHVKGVQFVIGPESGFTKEETDFLKEKGVQGVWLNENILRTETAAIAAASILSHCLDFS